MCLALHHRRSADPPVDEWDEDNVSLTSAPGAASVVLPAAHVVPPCGLGDADDHGDSFACATDLPLGSPVSGELRRAAAPDFDVFSFVLTETGTVRLETRGSTDTHGCLFDALGRRVAEDDDGGEGANFRLLRVLPPGRYFLRVEGFRGAEGAYLLEATRLR